MRKAPFEINTKDFIETYTNIIRINSAVIQSQANYICLKIWQYVCNNSTIDFKRLAAKDLLTNNQKEALIEAAEAELFSYLSIGGDMKGELGATNNGMTMTNNDLDSKAICREADNILSNAGFFYRGLGVF